MNTQTHETVSILAEIPDALHSEMGKFLDNHPEWDQDRVFNAALSLLLIQKGHMGKEVRRVYLDNNIDL